MAEAREGSNANGVRNAKGTGQLSCSLARLKEELAIGVQPAGSGRVHGRLVDQAELGCHTVRSDLLHGMTRATERLVTCRSACVLSAAATGSTNKQRSPTGSGSRTWR